MMKKKPIALLLSLLMSLNLMAVSASAEEPVLGAAEEPVFNIDVPAADADADESLGFVEQSNLSIQNYIDIVSDIEIPFGEGVALTDEQLEAVEAVLEYDRQVNFSAPVYKEAAYDFTSDYYYNQLSSTAQAAYDKMYTACNNLLNSTTTLSEKYFAEIDTKLSESEAMGLYWVFYYSNPQFFFLYNGFSYYQGTGKIILVCYDSCIKGAARNIVKASIDRTTDSWMREVDAISGNVAKEKWIADKLCNTIVYAYKGEHQSLKGALYDGVCVCNGYAMAMNYLCNAAGIETVTVVGPDHAWNRVLLYGKWYECDATWMDQTDYGYIDYDWFNKSTKTFQKNEGTSTAHKIHLDTEEQHILFYNLIDPPECLYDDPEDAVVKPIDEEKAAAFVERLYTILLNRGSDPDGKAYHLSNLKAGKSACDVTKEFLLSAELANWKLSNQEIVRRMYLTMLDREPDPSSAGWVKALDSGCSYKCLLHGFCESAEFKGICDSYGINSGLYTSDEPRDKNANLTAYISRMYTVALKRDYDLEGLNNHAQNYISGAANAKVTAFNFIFSDEFQSRNLSDEDYVECLYNTLFGRDSDPPGKENWLKLMNNGVTRVEVFDGFCGSVEFMNMVNGFGI